MNALTLEQLDLRGGEDVLEVGFGGGALLAALLEQTCGQVVGVDISAAMIARAQRRFSGVDRLHLVEASAVSLPIASASIDKACSVNSLYFWPDPAAALAELARVLRPGGAFSICFETAEELRKWRGHRFGFRLFQEEEVRALMEVAGFSALRRSEGRGRKPDRFLCLTGQRAAASSAT